MNKRHSTAFFAAFMMLLLLPAAPAYLQEMLEPAPPVAAQVTPARESISAYITAGYVGEHGPASPPSDLAEPQVLGVSTSGVPYQAQEVNRSHGVIELAPGQAATVWVDFLNTGTATWHGDGAHFVAMNLTNPTNRVSDFYHEYWPETYRPTALLNSEVEPGETGRFRFAVQAPETAGIYREHFNLVVENQTWIDGGYFTIIFGVGQSVERPPDFQASESNRSHGGTLSLDPGQEMTFWIEFENTGLKNWYNDGPHFIALNVDDPAGRESAFRHDYWTEYYYRPGRLRNERIYPTERGRFYFAVRAPETPGLYTEHFALVAEHHSFIPGGKFTIPFQVGSSEPVTSSAVAGEPDIRVGLYSTMEAVTLTNSHSYTVTNVTTGTQSTKSANEKITIPYAATAHWRISPTDPAGVMTISSYDNHPAWNQSLNDNTFRGTIELRTTDDDMWVINELPLESYLRGLAEVSNDQPAEYLKALITSARSYALWHITHGGKHSDKHFDVNATTDQIYRGYGFELRATDPVAATAATSGMVVTHPDAESAANQIGIALTPYSSGTDGRTRGWTEVWSGSGFPWLVSVDDPYGAIDNYNTLTGNHMVGMSATGARGYATKGWNYQRILQHYYTGTVVQKIY